MNHSIVQWVSGRKGLVFVAYVLVIALVMVVMDLPHPMRDDGFFIGTAVNMYRGGDYANPWIRDFQEHFTSSESDRFYLYTPMYPYLLYFWFKVFGVSAISVLSYSAFMVVLASVCWYYICKKIGLSWIAQFLFPLVYGGWLIVMSALRPDNTGVVLLLLGLVAIMYWRSWIGCFIGFVVIGGSLCVQPRLGFFAIILTSLALGWVWFNAVDLGCRLRWYKCLTALCAAILLHVVFLGMVIQGEWGIFLHDFLKSARASTQGLTTTFQGNMWAGFVNFWVGETRNIADALHYWLLRVSGCVALLLFAVMWKRINLSHRLFAGGLVAATLITMFVSTPHYFPILTVWMFALIVIGSILKSMRATWIIYIFFGGVILVAQWSKVVFQQVMTKPSAVNQMEIVDSFMKENPKALIVVDSDALRYVFDYKLPVSGILHEWCSYENVCFRRSMTEDERKIPKIWLVSPNALSHFKLELKKSILSPEYVKVMGREFKNMLVRPREMLVVTFP